MEESMKAAMDVVSPVFQFEEQLNEEYKKIWNRTMAEFESMEQHPILFYQRNPNYKTFIKTPLRTAQEDVDRFGKEFLRKSKEEKMKMWSSYVYEKAVKKLEKVISTH